MKKFKFNFFGKENKKIKFKRNVAYGYIFMILLGGFLLFLPITHANFKGVSMIDAFFVSASAFTDTGLTPIKIADTFNGFGHLIILALIQIGGIGLMTMKAVLFLLVNRKISTSDRMMIYTEQKQTDPNGMVKLIKDAVLIMVSFQFIFTIIICIHMVVNYNYGFLDGLWFSYFHTTAAITNAGFDLTGSSLMPFANDYLFQTYIMFLIVVGGLGFPVLVDIKRFLIAKRNKDVFRFSLFSKISLFTYFVVGIVGFISILILDSKFIFIENEGLKGIYYALFQTISSRSGGLSTMNLNEFSTGTKMVLTALMFIGAAPASTGGGIRTTTLALIFLYLKTYASNKTDVEAFNRRIPQKTIFDAYVSICVAVFMVFAASLFIISFNTKLPIMPIIFEVSSAFGTTGLSLGITPFLDSISKIIIAVLMVIGQLGITNAMIILAKNKEDSNLIRLPEENIAIG
ncbi:Trk-type K+ transport system membrane component [Bacilli bacterium PM5-9]|nr:Trk-type K+ transport system membrane component [Bacilli bacterium PM5-9]